ncbi:pimeloyl-ACP methyl ester carboxylesterase [Chryseobacterium ginsenosidimutans]|uniref:alpha/beta hydrolase n=1 Tax=Chryseobacterium ginsenosidimutans TaxID=687846 RepID=UPI002785752D|nr:alpha/beta hydrolase [Chryseobacterium ginsenosidimutans]MDQ0593285.1 pimeloyl-ACP methyl ester carboxylesterase [Chryseobacterium ginsenosidimutans]
MKTKLTFKKPNLILLIVALFISTNIYSQETKTIKNVVLVHGAFVDGSGWQGIYNILVKKGYNVSVTQHTLMSFDDDVKAVNRIIDQQDGPCILVGHSYGGAIITTAGNNSKVAGLVYVAAHAPDDGESEADNGKTYPPAYKSLIKGEDGLDYINPEKFPEDFAGGVSKEKAKFMAVSQTPTADVAFHAIIKNPAWKTKPSWYVVAKSDRIINPDLERMYARRAKSTVIEVDGASHCVFMTHPNEVANLIVSASNAKK